MTPFDGKMSNLQTSLYKNVHYRYDTTCGNDCNAHSDIQTRRETDKEMDIDLPKLADFPKHANTEPLFVSCFDR